MQQDLSKKGGNKGVFRNLFLIVSKVHRASLKKKIQGQTSIIEYLLACTFQSNAILCVYISVLFSPSDKAILCIYVS